MNLAQFLVVAFLISGSSRLGWIPFNLVKCVSFGQDGPDGARHFVGQRGNHHIEMPALQQPLTPTLASDCPAGPWPVQLDDMRMRKLEPRTQEAYIRAVRKLADFVRLLTGQ